jgi:hypothetical protein
MTILLSGCTAPAASSPSPSQAATTAVSPTAATIVPDYTGPRPLPASDGKPMLWPVVTSVTIADGGYNTETTRYGFVDVTGTLVVQPRYESYEYCRDAAGRVATVVAMAAGRKADVLDLTGKVVLRAPTAHAKCGPTGALVFSWWIDPETSKWQDGVLDLRTGRVLLSLAAGRHISVVDDRTVDVTEKGGSYFFVPRTGRRTPHPAWLDDGRLEAGAPGLPAATKRDGGRYGYLDLDGNWIVPPDLIGAGAFTAGHAVVKLATNRFTFLNTRLQRVGGEWVSVEAVWDASYNVVGYVVASAVGQGLLGVDLRTIVAPGTARIECSGDADGACSVRADDRLSMVALPEGTARAVPDGFRRIVGPGFVADVVGTGEDLGTRHVLAVESGAVAALDWPSSCEAVGTAWAVCAPSLPQPDDEEWQPDILPTVVIDAEGRRTALSSVTPVGDPADSGTTAYYMATTGRYTGLVDSRGTWLYRQSRFTRLED